MHGEEGRAGIDDALDALVHGVADVMQLQIEEYLLAGLVIRSCAKESPPA